MKIDENVEKLMTMFVMKECLKTVSDNNNQFDMIMEAVMNSIGGSSNENQFAQLLSGGSEQEISNFIKENSKEIVKEDSNKTNDLDEIAKLKAKATKNTEKSSENISSLSEKDRINKAVSNASEKYGVEPNLIMAIIKAESNFNPKAGSGAGALGLMQLMPENCKYYGVTDPYNIEQNVDAGTRHIKDYLNMFKGNKEMALMAYNAGQGTMQRRGVKSTTDLYKMPKETRNYVPKVMNYYRQGV